MPPLNLTAPTIDGAPEVAALLVADAGTWSGSGPLSFEYRWWADGEVVGTASTFRPSVVEQGVEVSVEVEATDATGSASETVVAGVVAPPRPSYATMALVLRYLEASDAPDAIPAETDTDAWAHLLWAAERDVDRVLGAYPLLADGRKLDPLTLTSAQRSALGRATAAAAEFRLTVTEESLVGGDDWVPGDVMMIRTYKRPAPKIADELAGSGLLVWSGIAGPDDVSTP